MGLRSLNSHVVAVLMMYGEFKGYVWTPWLLMFFGELKGFRCLY